VSFGDADPDPDRKAVARVARARVLWWQGLGDEARQACGNAIDLLAPTPLPRHILPAEALAACLGGQGTGALAALPPAKVHCCTPAYDEVVLDVGTLLLDALHSVEPAQIGLFLALSDEVTHRGIRFRISHIREGLAARIHDAMRVRACRARAQEEVRFLLG